MSIGYESMNCLIQRMNTKSKLFLRIKGKWFKVVVQQQWFQLNFASQPLNYSKADINGIKRNQMTSLYQYNSLSTDNMTIMSNYNFTPRWAEPDSLTFTISFIKDFCLNMLK